MASDVLRDEHRLALDGYHLDVIPTETGATLAKISLMSGPQVCERKVIELDALCPTRDEAILAAMLGFMNTAGDPYRLVQLAQAVAELPHIQPVPYTVLGAYGHTDWVSYYQHQDGRLFEVHHGLMAEELSQHDLDDAMGEDPVSGQEKSYPPRPPNRQEHGRLTGP